MIERTHHQNVSIILEAILKRAKWEPEERVMIDHIPGTGNMVLVLLSRIRPLPSNR